MKQTSILSPSHVGLDHTVSYVTPLGDGHMHNQNELFFLAQGTMTAHCNMESRFIKSPAIVIFPRFSIHSGASLDRNIYDRYKLFFGEETLANSLFEEKVNFFQKDALTVIPLRPHQADLLLTYFERLAALDKPTAIQYLSAWILYEISFWTNAAPPCAAGGKTDYVGEVMRFLAENFDQPITLEMLSERFFISRAKLVADFKRRTKLTVGEFLSLIRLNNAKSMLKQGKSVKAAALACGYTDESYFITKFTKLFGSTPGKYIKTAP